MELAEELMRIKTIRSGKAKKQKKNCLTMQLEKEAEIQEVDFH